MGSATLEVTGLRPLVRQLRGPAFRDVNKELRAHSRTIATDLLPYVSAAVARSAAPQAAAMAQAVRVHSDRVPVIVVGKVNPRFTSGFRRRTGDSRRRRGALALGVVAGPAGGKRATAVPENYYRIGRDPSWGPLGAALHGPILDHAVDLYLRIYVATLRAHGFDART